MVEVKGFIVLRTELRRLVALLDANDTEAAILRICQAAATQADAVGSRCAALLRGR